MLSISAFTFSLNSFFNLIRTIIDLLLVWYVIYLLISMLEAKYENDAIV
ncbi:hypothetical protein SD457_25530 [Coprobacillaceae bacterium CR2/5/TPMF4]|nr:hypothetical protein SD457_25530 [Coprobacillaceae bacterium CR2/5/TPMF4]